MDQIIYWTTHIIRNNSKSTATYFLVDPTQTNLKLGVGQTAVFKLSGNPTTGFSWLLNSKNNNLTVTYDYKTSCPSTSSSSSFPRTGCGGFYYIYVKRIRKGVERLNLVYKRSWEHKIAPSGELMVEIY